jgi:hypothetical protein
MFNEPSYDGDAHERKQWKHFDDLLLTHDDPSVSKPSGSARDAADTNKDRRQKFYTKVTGRDYSAIKQNTSTKQVNLWLDKGADLVKDYRHIY